jgi:hypothetical protein
LEVCDIEPVEIDGALIPILKSIINCLDFSIIQAKFSFNELFVSVATTLNEVLIFETANILANKKVTKTNQKKKNSNFFQF